MGHVGGKVSKRRRKMSTKKSPNQKPTHPSFGKPATINDLPAETLLEICNFMEPVDVLHITRTNTFLRQLVRNNDMTWRIARQNMSPDFPDCPPGISELKYAIFVFGKKCMVCGASGPLERQFALVLRACHDCIWSTLFGTKDPVCVKTRGMVLTLRCDGLRGLLHSISGSVSCQSCFPTGKPGMAEGYDCSDILKLQKDLRQAKQVADKRKVVGDWELRFDVRSKLYRSIFNWMAIHEPHADETAIFRHRKYQIIRRLRAVEGITEAAIDRFMLREDKHYKRFVLQLHPLTDEEWEKMSARLILLVRPPPQTRSK